MRPPALNVLMPMAGLGSRFAAAGVSVPKPLIEVYGAPMFSLALASVRAVLPAGQNIGIVQAAHAIAPRLHAAQPDMELLELPGLTGGALETCLAAEPLVQDKTAPLLVLDCDLTFSAPAFFAAIAECKADGLLLSFTSQEPRFSYAAVQGARVLRTAEKQVISSHALTGAYLFRSGALFFELARGIVARHEKSGGGEFYVSSAYNALLAAGGVVEWRKVAHYWSMGTPPELAACLADPDFGAHVKKLQQSKANHG